LAGKSYISPLKSINVKKSSEVFTLNAYSVIELSRAFINKNVCANKNLSIVLVSSIYALVGSAANTAYAMSKAALHGITKSLSVELAPKNIRVNCIAPGFIKSSMMQNTNYMFDENRLTLLDNLHPLGLGEPTDIANACVFLLSDASRWITGSILHVDGGFTAQ